MSHGRTPPARTPLPVRAARLVALPLAALAAGCGAQASGGANDAPPGARKNEPPLVIAAEVEQEAMVRYLETTTRIESEREITIHPEVTGIVTAVRAEEGDHVRTGDVLCELDATDEDLALRDAEVALQEAKDAESQPVLDSAEVKARVEGARLSWLQAQRDYERDQRLFESKEVASPVSMQALEASRLAMETAHAEHEQAQISLEKVALAAQRAATAVSRAEVVVAQAERALAQRTIRAPFDGQIARRSVRLGQSVGPADAIFVLTDVDHVRAVFYRAQEELGLFRPGGARSVSNGGGPPAEGTLGFEARTEALPGATFQGRVIRVSPTIDRDSGQFRVTGVFDPPEEGGPTLLPGMLVRLRIATDRHEDALVVPKRAVRREGDFVYVLRITADRTVQRVLVDEGYEDKDRIEVIPRGEPGLAAGDRVVAVGSRDLEDGDPVRVEGEEPEEEPAAEAGVARTEPDEAADDATGAQRAEDAED